MGPDIDVYTQHPEPHSGKGKGCDKDTGEEYGPYGDYPWQTWAAMSDAFGPQEEVTICAKVTYNDEPVENKMVAFEIRDPSDNVVAWRSAPTNGSGIACVSFRIPWKGADAEDVFGGWLIMATVDIAEDVVMDKCRFRFGYIVNIHDIDVSPPSLYKLDELTIVLNLTNIAFTPKNVFVTVVAYDECGVPIAKFGSPATVNPVYWPTPYIVLTIPKWAFVGTGTIYANVFDASPYLFGTPMCPENGGMPTPSFQILNTPP
jgi:hypothetical protein